MEKLSQRREHLRTFFGRHAPPKDGQHLLQEPSGQANSDISTPELRFPHDQANSLAPPKVEARATNRMR